MDHHGGVSDMSFVDGERDVRTLDYRRDLAARTLVTRRSGILGVEGIIAIAPMPSMMDAVHHVAGPSDWPEARERIMGWRGTLLAAGVPIPPIWPGSWNARSGYERGQVLARDPSVTAVFCGTSRSCWTGPTSREISPRNTSCYPPNLVVRASTTPARGTGVPDARPG
jgi:DNA-binding LacI/PurR family transcriptional regulator